MRNCLRAPEQPYEFWSLPEGRSKAAATAVSSGPTSVSVGNGTKGTPCLPPPLDQVTGQRRSANYRALGWSGSELSWPTARGRPRQERRCKPSYLLGLTRPDQRAPTSVLREAQLVIKPTMLRGDCRGCSHRYLGWFILTLLPAKRTSGSGAQNTIVPWENDRQGNGRSPGEAEPKDAKMNVGRRGQQPSQHTLQRE